MAGPRIAEAPECHLGIIYRYKDLGEAEGIRSLAAAHEPWSGCKQITLALKNKRKNRDKWQEKNNGMEECATPPELSARSEALPLLTVVRE